MRTIVASRAASMARSSTRARGNASVVLDVPSKAARILEQLNELYPKPKGDPPLNHGDDFQFLVAVMLSAQTTDKKVNEVTPELFQRATDAAAMSKLNPSEVEKIIRTVGLAPTKSKNVVKMSQLLLERHEGVVPRTFEELEALPGVGHKTASVVMQFAFNLPAFPVDTHVHRLAARWGLSSGKDVKKTEEDLKEAFPEHTWGDVHLQMIFFGREHCPAQGHDRSVCPICKWAAVGVPPSPAAKMTNKRKASKSTTKDKGQIAKKEEVDAPAENGRLKRVSRAKRKL